MARSKYGLPGIYNATPITLTDQEGSALATNAFGQLVSAAPSGVTANQVQGTQADNAAVVGNPQVIAGAYNLSTQVYGTGDAATLQTDVNGNLKTLSKTSSTDGWPMYGRMDLGGLPPATDLFGALLTRGAISTDEGTSRANFTGAAYTTTIGSCTFTNGSYTVTGSGFASLDLHYPDYIKLDADGNTAWAPISYISSDTTITLLAAYTGTGGTGASSKSQVGQITGTGATSTVASGAATLALGTTAAAQTYIYKLQTGVSGIVQSSLSISQRIANQDIYFGFEQTPAGTLTNYARFRFTGTTNTQVITETAYNPTTTPTANEAETNTVTLPAGATTAAANTYRIDQNPEGMTFYINGILVATHTKRIPQYNKTLNGSYGLATVRGLNGTTPASGTSVVIDYIYLKNYDKLDVATRPVDVGYSALNIATATTTTVKSGAGYLHSIVVNTTAAGSITIYDNTAGSGTKIATLKASIGENTYLYDVNFSVGLTIVTGAASDITATYK